jgi:hypothetical protein
MILESTSQETPLPQVVIPSKLSLLRNAKLLEEMASNDNIRVLVVDKAIEKHFVAAELKLPLTTMLRGIRVDVIDSGFLTLLAIDKHGDFVGSYRGADWPHAHPCPECGDLIRCECPFSELSFDDTLALCTKCGPKHSACNSI